MGERRDGVEALLLNDPEYAGFVRDLSPGAYAEGAAKAILQRFLNIEDTLGRILARLRKPNPNDYLALQRFTQRFLSRTDPALKAYEQTKNQLLAATTRGKLSLDRLVASGTFVDGKVEI
jgi:hypothetical protein